MMVNIFDINTISSDRSPTRVAAVPEPPTVAPAILDALLMDSRYVERRPGL
jgi:hypothetical protein